MNMLRISLSVRYAILAAATALTGVATGARADDLKFRLSGDLVVPPVATKSWGFALIVIGKDMTISGKVVTSKIAATMAHIHIGKRDSNGPPIIDLVWAEDNTCGGNAWLVPEGTKLSRSHYEAYLAGNLYVNVHSDEKTSGVIRAQLLPPASAL